ncbi:hypothetical protein DID88_007936 [Monilinia fructigena]|uniref:Uncharacterized protein n=1 Tax=Monilinia fructigena TaxID=38457 RepID=A0A395J4S2_9HELO|nr:hypothetical protein DID88_007936 [Monilinia fructigena]
MQKDKPTLFYSRAKILWEKSDSYDRFDAQLHVIHSTLDSFTTDPISEEYEPWTKNFNVEKKTDDINTIFLRHSIETAEAKRRDLLKGAAATEQEEEVKWASDSEDDSEEESSDSDSPQMPNQAKQPQSSDPPRQNPPPPSTPQRKLIAMPVMMLGWCASGVPSRAPNSPKEKEKEKETPKEKNTAGKKDEESGDEDDDSEEEDWE